MSDQPAAKFRTVDDLNAALDEGGAGRCDRCRREAGTMRLDVRIRHRGRNDNSGPRAAVAKVLATVCEACAVDVVAVVGRAVGRVR